MTLRKRKAQLAARFEQAICHFCGKPRWDHYGRQPHIFLPQNGKKTPRRHAIKPEKRSA